MQFFTQTLSFLLKLKIKWYRYSTTEKLEKRLSHIKAFDGAYSCVTFMFDYILANWKVEEKRKIKEKFGF